MIERRKTLRPVLHSWSTSSDLRRSSAHGPVGSSQYWVVNHKSKLIPFLNATFSRDRKIISDSVDSGSMGPICCLRARCPSHHRSTARLMLVAVSGYLSSPTAGCSLDGRASSGDGTAEGSEESACVAILSWWLMTNHVHHLAVPPGEIYLPGRSARPTGVIRA